MPKISVLMSAYNAEKTIELAILSILNQDFTDFNFIIIDDGSIDRTKEIISLYEKIDSRIILISNSVNRGLIFSLNLGLSNCDGEWVARMDADDIAMPNRFTTQLSAAKRLGAAVLGSYAVNYIDDQIGTIIKVPIFDDDIKKHLLFNSAFINPTVMIRRDIFNYVKYSPEFELAEDYDLYSQIANLGFQMANLEDVLLCYRRHENQLTKTKEVIILENKNKISERNILHFIRSDFKRSQILDLKFMPTKNLIDFNVAINLLKIAGVRAHSRYVINLFLESFRHKKIIEIFRSIFYVPNPFRQLLFVFFHLIDYFISINKIQIFFREKRVPDCNNIYKNNIIHLSSKRIFK